MAYTIMKYLRISQEDIDLDGSDKYESNSIVSQRGLLDDFIAKMPEFQDCAVVETLDDGRSGTNFNRPGIMRLLEMAQSGDIDCIVVKDLSRFGRNMLEVGDYLEQIFPAWGVRFISVNDLYDSAASSSKTGVIDLAFRNLIAELYSQDLSDKVRSAKNSATKSGKIITTYPSYGYDKDKNDHHKFVIDTDAALVVKKIFDLAEQGISIAEIIRTLNTENIPTKQMSLREKGFTVKWGRGDCWSSYAVGKILRDERYTGKWIYGQTRLPYVGAAKAKPVPRSEWIIVPGAIPAIISEKQYQRVQEVLERSSKRKTTSRPELKTIFGGKVKCGDCGRMMRYRPRKHGYGLFLCDMYLQSDKYDCTTGKTEESMIYDLVLKTIQDQVALADTAKIQIKSKSSHLYSKAEALRDKDRALRVEIEKVKVTKMSLWEKHHLGEITREAFQRESEKLTSQITKHEDAIAAYESESKALEMESVRENKYVERFGKQVGIQTLTREVVDEFVKSIYIYAPDRIEIMLNYADEYAHADEYAEAAKLAGNESTTSTDC